MCLCLRGPALHVLYVSYTPCYAAPSLNRGLQHGNENCHSGPVVIMEFRGGWHRLNHNGITASAQTAQREGRMRKSLEKGQQNRLEDGVQGRTGLEKLYSNCPVVLFNALVSLFNTTRQPFQIMLKVPSWSRTGTTFSWVAFAAAALINGNMQNGSNISTQAVNKMIARCWKMNLSKLGNQKHFAFFFFSRYCTFVRLFWEVTLVNVTYFSLYRVMVHTMESKLLT